MTNLIIGIALGFCVATYGVTGVIEVLEKGLTTVKTINTTMEKQ